MFCIGEGYDVHKLVEGRDLILGGVKLPYEKGLLGHSDADVLIHAIMDSILGALALGDIGKFFPDTDPKYKGISSMKLLKILKDEIIPKDVIINNIDATVMCEKPKLRDYIDTMRKNVADSLSIPVDRVSIKATTEEGLGFTGEGLGIAVRAVCLLDKKG